MLAQRKWLFLLLMVVMMLGTACGEEQQDAGQNGTSGKEITEQGADSGTNVEPGGQQEGTGNITAPPAPAEISIYNVGDEQVEQIRKKFPQFTIHHLKPSKGAELPDLVMAGIPVDLYVGSIAAINNPVHLRGVNMEYDMTELAQKHQIDLERFEPALIDAIQKYGGLYGIPVSSNVMTLYYNKDLFDKFGVDYPEDGLFWSEMKEINRRLTVVSEGNPYYGFSTSPTHYFNVNQYSVPYVDPETNLANINSEAWRKMLDIVPLSLMNSSPYSDYITGNNGNLRNINRAFAEDKNVAMMIYFVSSVAEYVGQGVNFDIAALPMMDDLPGLGSQAYPTYYCITTTSKVKDASMEIIKYLITDEYQLQQSKQGMTLPALKDEAIKQAYGSESDWKDKNLQAAFFHKIAPDMFRTKFDNMVQTEALKGLLSVITGKSDVNTAMRAAQDNANKIIMESTK